MTEFLHKPETPNGNSVILTHGAGSDSNSRLLVAVAEALSAAGFVVLRFDLPFRQSRPQGPPLPAHAAADRAGLRDAANAIRERTKGRLVLGGHSYGGRQSSMLAAEDPKVADALLLLSYPLHPPRKPEQLRTAHLPDVKAPAVFVHGTRDPFGSPEEMRGALQHMGGPSVLSLLQGAGHDLRSGKFDIAELLLKPLTQLLAAQ
jgi:predicted alpha/beta-hydrolase family hydrolase